ncbi:hypothetical protein ES703_40335 [subsurface metagenome]
MLVELRGGVLVGLRAGLGGVRVVGALVGVREDEDLGAPTAVLVVRLVVAVGRSAAVGRVAVRATAVLERLLLRGSSAEYFATSSIVKRSEAWSGEISSTSRAAFPATPELCSK